MSRSGRFRQPACEPIAFARVAHRLLRLVALLWLASPASASAFDDRAGFDVARAPLAGQAIGRAFQVFQDATGQLTFSDVRSSAWSARFVPTEQDAPSFGFNDHAFWLRLEVVNSGDVPREWLLELAYPQLDRVELYAVRDDGKVEHRVTGDRVPFAQRDVPYRHFLFQLSESPHHRQTYYFRVKTDGSVSLPFFAWTAKTFFAHQNREQPLLWMIYGLVLVMALYNAFVYVSVREREYLYYCFYVVSCATAQATLNGHAFQYLLPDSPWLANRMLLFSTSVTVWTALLFIRRFLNLRESLPWMYGTATVFSWASAAIAAVSLFAPYKVSIILVVVAGIPANLTTFVGTLVLVHRRYRPALFFAAAWITFLVGVLLSYLRLLSIVPTNVVTTWAIQLGAALEVVLLSLALADRINIMRRGLSTLNEKLSDKVGELRLALVQAQAATKARGEFLATVSHELRTPLHAIINIPPALVLSAPQVRVARCAACEAEFALDPEEQVEPTTPCPECARTGSLEVSTRRIFAGDPEALVSNLNIVERSGKHLLEMVNGILDFTKLGAGRLELRVSSVDLSELIEDVVASLRDLARQSGVQLVVGSAVRGAELQADALRVKQVLFNLIGNAIKFSDGRGKVEVGIHEQPEAYVLYVKDEGIGIDTKDLAKVFRTFEQVDQGDTRKYGGTGLGLSISQSLVELHGGRIWVESELGRGATFYVRLPLHAHVKTPAAQAAE
ncbi:MAG: hybrid sensor histidine kinase/response regulator [Myxococcaceae bacterium]|nr:hybrid sensor histidine kinase/response regulator [Myxococcaceae bacterium]